MTMQSVTLRVLATVGACLAMTINLHEPLWKDDFNDVFMKAAAEYGPRYQPSGVSDVLKSQFETKSKSSVLSINMLDGSAPFTCQSMSTDYNPYAFCSGVVDYPFIVVDGTTLDDLESHARSYATYYNSFINSQCLTDVKRVICAGVYMRCLPNVDANDYTTFQAVYNSTAVVPYMAPCGSLCTATSYTGSTCMGLLEGLGLAPDCNQINPYTGLPVYDHHGTPYSEAGEGNPLTNPVCNDLASSKNQQLVSDQKELYIGELCSGILTEFYVPPSALLDPNLPTMMPPYVLQSMVEAFVYSTEQYVPRYLAPECQLARRELKCATSFLHPEANNDLASMFGTVYLPSFPHKAICLDYSDKCAAIIANAPAAAYVDCNASFNGLELYPTEPQVVLSLNLGYVVLNLATEPYAPVNVTAQIAAECPYGMAVPEDPSIDTIIWIPGTACAVACPTPIYTAQEFSDMNMQMVYANWFGIISCIFQFSHLMLLKPSRRNIFLFLYVLVTFSFFVIWLVPHYAAATREEVTCSSNASWYTKKTWDESPSSASCMVTSLIKHYTMLLAYWVLISVSVEIWLRVVKGRKDVSTYRYFYFYGTLAVTVALAMVQTFYGNPDVLIPGAFALGCTWGVADKELNLYLYTVPAIIYCLVSMLFTGHAVYVCIMVSMRARDGSAKSVLQSVWKSYSMLFLFLAMYFILYPYQICVLAIAGYAEVDHVTNSFIDWLTCLITNFVTPEDTTYLAICGNYPEFRFSVTLTNSNAIVTYAISAVQFYITVNGDVRAFYWNIAVTAIKYLGLEKFATNLSSTTKLTVMKRYSANSSATSEIALGDRLKHHVPEKRSWWQALNPATWLSDHKKAKKVYIAAATSSENLDAVAKCIDKPQTARDESSNDVEEGLALKNDAKKPGAEEDLRLVSVSAHPSEISRQVTKQPLPKTGSDVEGKTALEYKTASQPKLTPASAADGHMPIELFYISDGGENITDNEQDQRVIPNLNNESLYSLESA